MGYKNVPVMKQQFKEGHRTLKLRDSIVKFMFAELQKRCPKPKKVTEQFMTTSFPALRQRFENEAVIKMVERLHEKGKEQPLKLKVPKLTKSNEPPI